MPKLIQILENKETPPTGPVCQRTAPREHAESSDPGDAATACPAPCSHSYSHFCSHLCSHFFAPTGARGARGAALGDIALGPHLAAVHLHPQCLCAEPAVPLDQRSWGGGVRCPSQQCGSPGYSAYCGLALDQANTLDLSVYGSTYALGPAAPT